MYVHRKWLCEDCNRAWSKRAKELDGKEFKFVVYHDESIAHSPEEYSKINATWIPPFHRFLELFLPKTKYKFVRVRRKKRTMFLPKAPRQTKGHIELVMRNAPFSFEGGLKHWAQSTTIRNEGTFIEFKHPSSRDLQHLMLCLIHEFTAHVHINSTHPDINHYTHTHPEYGSPPDYLTGHCRKDFTECLNGFVYDPRWLSNPAMLELLQQCNFSGKPRLGFELPIDLKFQASLEEKSIDMRSLGKREKRKLGSGSRDNPPQGLGFVAAQYNFDMPLPLIDFEGTIEDLQSAGFNAEQTFNMSGGDSIKQIKSKDHPGFSAWMNENSTKVKFRVASEKTDEELLAFKRAIQDALGIKKNPADDEVPEKEELEGESLIAKLKKAKEHSDVGNYKEKKIILEALMKESPDDWVVDQPKGEDGSGKFPGIKHKSTNFQFHLPKNAIPDSIKVKGEEPAPTVEEETKGPEKVKSFKPYISETQRNMRSKSRITFTQVAPKTNPSATNKQRLSLDGVMEPSVHVLKKAFGFPRVGDVIGKFEVVDIKFERKLRAKHKLYDFPWQIVCKVDGEASKKEIADAFERYMKNREAIPADLGASYMVELGYIEYEITKANRLYITGKAVADRIMTNPAELDKDGQLYIKDFSPVSQKRVERKFRTENLKGKMPDDDFLRQIYGKCQLFGEAAGWVLPNNTMKWKKGHPLLNETRVDGFVVPEAIAYWHTHPKAFEPSQTSPDDFLIYHGLFTNNDMCNFFTVMSDRIDHFIFKKKDRIDKEIVAETILEFEDDVRVVFEDAMEEYQTGLQDNEALDTQKQTAHIVKKLNKLVPEFHCTFKCYKIDPKTIIANS